MALTPETGAGLPDADSYISVEDASAYHDALGNAAWAALASDTVREQLLRKAAMFMVQEYRTRWQGMRVSSTQALDWPRYGVEVDSFAVDSDSVPVAVKNACAELALRAATADLAPDVGQRVKRKKVDVIEVEYAEGSSQNKQYRAVDMMLAPYLAGASGGMNIPVVRA